MAVVLSWVIGLFLLAVSGEVASSLLWALLAPTLPVAMVGLIDDRGHVASPVRFGVHLGVSLIAVVFCNQIAPVGAWVESVGWNWMPLPMVWLVMVIALSWLINLFNFMDGIDGILSIEVISVLCCFVGYLYLVAPDTQTPPMSVSLVLISATTGFFCWNFPRAKLFMGDVGSGFSGLAIGIIVSLSVLSSTVTLWFWLVLLAVFWVDATYTLLRRIADRQPFLQAHRSHAYQILARRWNSHAKVSLIVGAVNCFWLAPLAFLTQYLDRYALFVVFAALAPLFFVQRYVRAGEKAS